MVSPLLALLSLATVAATVSAESGGMLLECPSADWSLYRDRNEASCLRLMPQPRLFDDAVQACFALQARLLSLQHRRSKILAVNDLIVKQVGEDRTLWFFDPLDTHHDMVKWHREHHRHHHHQPHLHHDSREDRWLVISPSADQAKIELLVNMTEVPRSFICEAPARPAAQRPQMEREPEDVFIADELLLPPELPLLTADTNGTHEADQPPESRRKARPFIVTFNCQAFGIPKPTVEWALVGEDENAKLTVQKINTTTIDNLPLPIGEGDATEVPLYFNLQRDCKRHPCPHDSIQERSQLIVVNPQLLLEPSAPRRRVACIAVNDFGSVLSREAQILPAKLGDFMANNSETVSVRIGQSTVVSNAISAEPDAAAVECFRVLDGDRHHNAPAKLLPMEEVNRATRGGIQMSRATFDLIVDIATPEDAGEYLCQASLPNGRLGRVTRDRQLRLELQPCPKAISDCDISARKVSVVPGYPALLSMNPLSNRVVRHGDDFQLDCPCTGKRHPTEPLQVQWDLNNRTDLTAILIPIFPEASRLLLPDANARTHSGLYKCRCLRGSDESDWSGVQVDVLPPLTPVQHRDLVRVTQGTTATIDCGVQSVEGAVSVSVHLLRGTQTLEQSDRFRLTRKSDSEVSLEVVNATESDTDVYGCRVLANHLGQWTDYNTYYTTLLVDKTG